LKLGDKIELLDDPETVLATVVSPKAEEPVEGAAAAEPEVIKKGKGEDEKK